MINELFQLAINNMLRARARLMMTAGGVLVGTAAVILLIALTIGLQASAEADIGNDPYMLQMQVMANRFNWQTGTENPDAPILTPQTVNNFWRIPGVRAVLAGIRLNNANLRVGTTQGWGDMIGIDPAVLPYMGLRAQKGELSLNRGEVLVGMDVGTNFYDPFSEEYEAITYDLMNEEVILSFVEYTDIGEQVIEEIPLKVVGILDNSSDFNYRVLLNVEDVHEYNAITGTEFDPETFVHDDVTVYATSRDTVEDVFNTIKDLGFQVYGSIEYLQSLNGFFSSMRMMLGGIGGVALLVAAFGVANTMTMRSRCADDLFD
jgi:ABC-type antimicrobial peptide transport system permease subunit